MLRLVCAFVVPCDAHVHNFTCGSREQTLEFPKKLSSRLACWPPALLGTGGASRQELSGVSRLGVSDLTLLVVSVNVVSVNVGVCECRVHCMYFALLRFTLFLCLKQFKCVVKWVVRNAIATMSSGSESRRARRTR